MMAMRLTSADVYRDGQWVPLRGVNAVQWDAGQPPPDANADDPVEPWGQTSVTLRLNTAQWDAALRELRRSTLRLWLYGARRVDSARRRRVARQLAVVRRRAARRGRR